MIRLHHGIIVAALFVLAVLVAVLAWLTTTDTGARWILTQVPDLRIKQVQGSLAGGLRLSGIAWDNAETRFHAQSLWWHWRPTRLLRGEMDFSSLQLREVELHLPAPSRKPSPIDLRWPALPLWTRLIALKLSSVTCTNLRVWQGTQETFVLSQAALSELVWQYGRLRIEQLSAKTPQGTLHLTADLQIEKRGLQSRGMWTRGDTAHALTVKWATHWRGISPQAFGGALNIQVRQNQQRFELGGMAQIFPHQVLLQSLRLSNSTLKRPAKGHWRIDLPANTNGDYQVSGGFEQIVAKAIPGVLPVGALALDLRLRGNARHYAGQLAINGGPPFGRIQGALNGNDQGLRYQYAGELLGARLLPSVLTFRWQPSLHIHGQIRVRNLQTQRLMTRVPGAFSGDLSVDVRQSAQKIAGVLYLHLLPSQFYRQTLQGEASVHFRNNRWNLQNAQFRGPGAQLNAHGNLQQRLSFAVTVAKWQKLLPGAQGRSSVQGWVARPRSRWVGEIQGTGRHLAYRGVSLSALKAHAALDAANDIQATVGVRNLEYGGYHADLQAHAQGPLTRFALRLEAQWPQSHLTLTGLIGHRASAWALQLEKTTLTSIPLGNWQLLHPSTLRWTKGAASLSKMVLTNPVGARITAQGRYHPAIRQAELGLDLHALPLDFHARNAHASLRGFLNAHLQARCQGVCDAQGDWDFQKTQLQWRRADTTHRIDLQQFTGQIRWLSKDLSLTADLSLAQGWGGAHVALRSPATLSLPWHWNSGATLQGAIQAQLGAPLFAALPVGALQMRPQGQGSINTQILGTWAHPQWKGTARLQGLGFFVPQAGLNVRDVDAQLEGDGKQLQITRLQATSGSGQILGTGSIQLQQKKGFNLHITGKHFTALNLPQVQAVVSPDLSIAGDLQKVDIQGDIHTNRLRILGTDFSGPKPSSDVVFVKNMHKSGGIALRGDIHVTLGNDARVIIGGLRARLVGSLAVKMRAAQSPQVDGTLRMVDGQYAIYGHTLDFQRGSILFHGAASQANLDVLAVRTIKSSSSFAVDNTPVHAGVQVAGTLQAPQVTLYSKPAMSQTDILSYLVLGTPSSGLKSQNALLSAAAGTLFSASRAALFGNNLNSGGIDVGVSSDNENSGLAGAMVTLGHYLTPDLYLSVGQSVLGSGTVARLRYRVSRHIELQTESGTQNGANIFYRIDF